MGKGCAIIAKPQFTNELNSRLILHTIVESSSLARISCFLMLLWVLKAMVGLFGKSLESSGVF